MFYDFCDSNASARRDVINIAGGAAVQ
jgi:hypothetical protein